MEDLTLGFSSKEPGFSSKMTLWRFTGFITQKMFRSKRCSMQFISSNAVTMVCLLLLYLLSFVRKKFNKSRPAGTRLTKLTVFQAAYHEDAHIIPDRLNGEAY